MSPLRTWSQIGHSCLCWGIPCKSNRPPLTQVAIAHHIFGTVAQASPHVSDEVVELSHGQGDVVLVHVTLVSEGLGDPLPQAPQHLSNAGSQKSTSHKQLLGSMHTPNLSLNTCLYKTQIHIKRFVGEETLTCLYFLLVRCHSSISDQTRSHGPL